MRRKFIFDMHALIRSSILAGFLTLLIWLVSTQQLSLYINPRFKVLTELSGFVLFAMLIVQAVTIIRPAAFNSGRHTHSHGGRWSYLPFIIVLTLAFWVPGNTLNANLVSTKGLNSQLSAAAKDLKDMPRPLAVELKKTRSIKVTDLTFTEVMSELQFFPEDYIGKELTVTGFVFRPPAATKNQFSIVRYVVMCCTSDALPYGVLCELTGADKYEEGTWLSLSGVIQMTKYEDRLVPSIKVTSQRIVEQPKNPYVFPYN